MASGVLRKSEKITGRSHPLLDSTWPQGLHCPVSELEAQCDILIAESWGWRLLSFSVCTGPLAVLPNTPPSAVQFSSRVQLIAIQPNNIRGETRCRERATGPFGTAFGPVGDGAILARPQIL